MLINNLYVLHNIILHFQHLGGISWFFKEISIYNFRYLNMYSFKFTSYRSTDFKSFYESRFRFGTLFQNYGLFPPTLILIISIVILNYYIFKTFKNKLAKTLTLILSFVFTLIKPMNSCQKLLNICYLHQKISKIISQWVWQIMKETLEMLYL